MRRQPPEIVNVNIEQTPPGLFGWLVYGMLWFFAIFVVTIAVFVILFYTGVDVVPTLEKIKIMKGCDHDDIDCGDHDKGKIECKDCGDGTKWECKAKLFWSSSPKWKEKSGTGEEESIDDFADGFGVDFCADDEQS